jgi:hypothetical protein
MRRHRASSNVGYDSGYRYAKHDEVSSSGVSPETFRRGRSQPGSRRLGGASTSRRPTPLTASGLTFRYFAEVERAKEEPDARHAVRHRPGAPKVKVADLVDVEPGARLDLDGLALEPPKTGRKPTRAPDRALTIAPTLPATSAASVVEVVHELDFLSETFGHDHADEHEPGPSPWR